jgi:formylglycine-generating enzyme required for sulfatase activity/tetratricopeptide (TPR) repeat protein
MAEIIGSSLGKYDILEELGRGGFGAVYRVRNRDLEREEALKVLGQHRQWDPTFVRRFQREARTAARLRHPHIVTIFEVGETEGTHYISMEYLPGETLAQVIAREGALPPARLSRLIAQVAEALDYAHAQGLIHRDVKPNNVMVGPGDNATLMDFGLVKAADHSELSQELYSSGAGFTSAAAAMGTPEYMAPELAEPNAAAVDYRADIYSLGVVAYQALTGHLPFSAPTPVAVLRAQLDLAPPPLTQWVAGLPAPISAAVLRALAKNPAERYPSAGGFAAALAEAAQRADAERTRTEKVAALYTGAQDALAAKNWAAALAACGQVMALDANYRDVGALFDQANRGLVKQREWEAQQDERAAQYDQGVARLAEGKWDEAIALLQPLANDDQVFRDADRKLAEATAAQQAEAAQRQEQIGRLYEKALLAYRTAKDHLAEILALQPDWRDPAGTLDPLLDLPGSQVAVEAKVETGLGAAEASAKADGGPGSRLPWRILGPAMAGAGILLAIWGAANIARPVPAPQVIERIITQQAPTPQVIERVVTATPVSHAPVSATNNSLTVPLAPGVSLELVRVPAGEFIMGSDKAADPQAYNDEMPQSRVTLPEYWIGKYEVTNAQYAAFISATGHAAPPGWPGGQTPDGKDTYPVANLSWNDAVAFGKWASTIAGRTIRLPTEAEWEKAARGTDGRIYPWGNTAPDTQSANFNSSIGATTPVGHYPPGASPFGALDMAGNVWEWTSSLYQPYPYQADDDREAATGPDMRVLRGGSLDSESQLVRCAFRFGRAHESRNVGYGFRVASPDR